MQKNFSESIKNFTSFFLLEPCKNILNASNASIKNSIKITFKTLQIFV